MSLLRFRPSPPMVVGLVALFFAIGGSAFAIGQRAAPQARCANGSIRGFAIVTGDPTKGLANLPETYVSGPTYMKASFNCAGKPVRVRRQGQVFYILFPGNTGKVAVANVITTADPKPVAVEAQADGSFKVTVSEANQPQGLGIDVPWEIVLV